MSFELTYCPIIFNKFVDWQITQTAFYEMMYKHNKMQSGVKDTEKTERSSESFLIDEHQLDPFWIAG